MKVKFQSLAALLLALLFVVGTLTPASAAGSKNVKLNKTTVVLEQSATIKLSVSGTKEKVKWASSDKKVAKVSKGKVTAVAEGSAIITATVDKEKYTCKVTVVDNNREEKAETVDSKVTSFTVATSDGGDFICKESKLAIKFELDTTTGGAQLLIYDALDDCVFAETFSTIKAGKETSFTWMGKDDTGSYVHEGTYFVKVKCKDTVNDLGNFTVYAGDEFAGGNGSPSNPYKVSTIEQFKKIVRHANACFIQTTDLDFEYENFETMFTTDPFNGTYDGNNKKISNIVVDDPIFRTTSTSACVKNMDIVNAILNVPTDQAWFTSILVNYNYGKIDSCKVNASINGGGYYRYWVGFVSCRNYGTINNCEVSGTLDMNASGDGSNDYNCYFGSVAAVNENGAKIVNCKNTASLTVISKRWYTYSSHVYAGGIVGCNNGTIISTETKTAVKGTDETTFGHLIMGEIAGNNNGTIQNSYYNAN